MSCRCFFSLLLPRYPLGTCDALTTLCWACSVLTETSTCQNPCCSPTPRRSDPCDESERWELQQHAASSRRRAGRRTESSKSGVTRPVSRGPGMGARGHGGSGEVPFPFPRLFVSCHALSFGFLTADVAAAISQQREETKVREGHRHAIYTACCLFPATAKCAGSAALHAVALDQRTPPLDSGDASRVKEGLWWEARAESEVGWMDGGSACPHAGEAIAASG